MDINSKIIGNLCDTVVETYSKGQSLIEKNMYFVHLGDWISWFLSDMRGVDSIEVDVIDYLKGELDQVN
jgi:glucose/mannose-6-phosphate isomerase